MTKTTKQMIEWAGSFGREYTDRNALSFEEFESLYRQNFGVSRTDLNQKFLESIDCSAQILEVGSNVGNQLLCLQKMGFQNLFGIELQNYAVELSKKQTSGINIIQGSAFEIPFKNGYFDLVFTSGVLIHISPSHLAKVMNEIHRCTKEYIFGFEYWANECTPVPYRGYENLLWKADYAQMYLQLFSDLIQVKEEKIPYLINSNIDSMFLLKKKRRNQCVP